MSKHKLVPVEPTQAMGVAGCYAVPQISHEEAQAAYKAMLAAAPEVEQEPVAWIINHPNWGSFNPEMEREIAERYEADKPGSTTPLYLHSQQTQETSRNESFAFRADGEANFYTVAERGGNWTARIQFNGEIMCGEQEIMVAVITDALAAHRKQGGKS